VVGDRDEKCGLYAHPFLRVHIDQQLFIGFLRGGASYIYLYHLSIKGQHCREEKETINLSTWRLRLVLLS